MDLTLKGGTSGSTESSPKIRDIAAELTKERPHHPLGAAAHGELERLLGTITDDCTPHAPPQGPANGRRTRRQPNHRHQHTDDRPSGLTERGLRTVSAAARHDGISPGIPCSQSRERMSTAAGVDTTQAPARWWLRSAGRGVQGAVDAGEQDVKAEFQFCGAVVVAEFGFQAPDVDEIGGREPA